MPSTSSSSYHHGDLPTALVRAAMELLEENGAGELSLRAAARRAGVSPGAPYRHFADRDALVSAVAAVGYQELADRLMKAQPEPTSVGDLSDIAVAYVRFAVDRPGLFRAMFAEPCDPTSPERVAATTAMHDYVESVAKKTLPDAEPAAMADALWAFVHGMAFLYLDGKFDSTNTRAMKKRVSAAVEAILAS